jgi:hypothetical protein
MYVRDLDLKRLSNDLVNAGFKPEIRLEKTIASFAEIAGLVNNGDIDAPSLATAFFRLARSQESDTPPIKTRRDTLSFLAIAILEQASSPSGGYGNVRGWFESQIAAFQGSEDDRYRAMAETAKRELLELKAG